MLYWKNLEHIDFKYVLFRKVFKKLFKHQTYIHLTMRTLTQWVDHCEQLLQETRNE